MVKFSIYLLVRNVNLDFDFDFENLVEENVYEFVVFVNKKLEKKFGLYDFLWLDDYVDFINVIKEVNVFKVVNGENIGEFILYIGICI